MMALDRLTNVSSVQDCVRDVLRGGMYPWTEVHKVVDALVYGTHEVEEAAGKGLLTLLESEHTREATQRLMKMHASEVSAEFDNAARKVCECDSLESEPTEEVTQSILSFKEEVSRETGSTRTKEILSRVESYISNLTRQEVNLTENTARLHLIKNWVESRDQFAEVLPHFVDATVSEPLDMRRQSLLREIEDKIRRNTSKMVGIGGLTHETRKLIDELKSGLKIIHSRVKILMQEEMHNRFLRTKWILFSIGDIVEITGGPFKGGKGRIGKIDDDKEELIVELLETPYSTVPVKVKTDCVRIVK